jgi:hypothetical protein
VATSGAFSDYISALSKAMECEERAVCSSEEVEVGVEWGSGGVRE